MCGRSYPARSTARTPERGRGPGVRGGGPDNLFGLDPESLSPRGQVGVAASVITPVALSGVLLAVFVPQLWWIFTTYFWVAFPAFGLLGRGLAGISEAQPGRASAGESERELLVALRDHGELSPVRAAAETSLPVAVAEERLRELAGEGHLAVRVRGGGLFYALWEVPRERAGLDEPEPGRQGVEGKGAA